MNQYPRCQRMLLSLVGSTFLSITAINAIDFRLREVVSESRDIIDFVRLNPDSSLTFIVSRTLAGTPSETRTVLRPSPSLYGAMPADTLTMRTMMETSVFYKLLGYVPGAPQKYQFFREASIEKGGQLPYPGLIISD